MDSQERKQLMDYIKAAIDLETEIATQESIIKAYTENSKARKPKLKLHSEPYKPSLPSTADSSTGGGLIGLIFGIMLVPGGFACIGASCSPNVLGDPKDAILMGLGLLLVGFVLFIPFIAAKIKARHIYEEQYHNYQQELERYHECLEKTQMSNKKNESEHKKRTMLWTQNTKQNVAKLQSYLSQTSSLLETLYAQDKIYPKYHNLPALTSIYEYLITGRCDELAGPHGAYNLYEDEVRKDTVISQLNVVIENLEQIKQNQYMLYQQAKKISDDSSEIKRELNSIHGYTVQLTQLTALNAYYSGLTATNTKISAALQLLNG